MDDGVDGDGQQETGLARAAVRGVGVACVLLGEAFDALGSAVGRGAGDASPYGEVAGGVIRVGDADGHTGVALNVFGFAVALDGVDEDVFTIGVDPGLGELRRAVRHGGGDEAGAGPVQQFEEFAGHGCHEVSPFLGG